MVIFRKYYDADYSGFGGGGTDHPGYSEDCYCPECIKRRDIREIHQIKSRIPKIYILFIDIRIWIMLLIIYFAWK